MHCFVLSYSTKAAIKINAFLLIFWMLSRLICAVLTFPKNLRRPHGICQLCNLGIATDTSARQAARAPGSNLRVTAFAHAHTTKRVENPAVHIDYLPTHSAPFVRKDLSPFIPPWVASRTTPWTRAAADRWRSASRLDCVLAREKDLCLACVLAREKGLVPSLCTSPLEMHYRPLGNGSNGAGDGGQLSAPLAATV